MSNGFSPEVVKSSDNKILLQAKFCEGGHNIKRKISIHDKENAKEIKNELENFIEGDDS